MPMWIRLVRKGREAAVSSLIEFIPLEEGVEGWARRIRTAGPRQENPALDERYELSSHVQGLEQEYVRLTEANRP